jgi:hypothetical protein
MMIAATAKTITTTTTTTTTTKQCDQETSQGNFKIYRPYSQNAAHIRCKNKSDTIKNKAKNQIKINQKTPKQHTGKAQNQGSTENIHTSEHTNAEVQNIQHGK